MRAFFSGLPPFTGAAGLTGAPAFAATPGFAATAALAGAALAGEAAVAVAAARSGACPFPFFGGSAFALFARDAAAPVFGFSAGRAFAAVLPAFAGFPFAAALARAAGLRTCRSRSFFFGRCFAGFVLAMACFALLGAGTFPGARAAPRALGRAAPETAPGRRATLDARARDGALFSSGLPGARFSAPRAGRVAEEPVRPLAAAHALATSDSTDWTIEPTGFDAGLALGNEEFLRAAVAQRSLPRGAERPGE